MMNNFVLLGFALLYLLVLFLIAYAVERKWIGEKIVTHPAVYVLSFGIFCSAWTFYGSTGMAYAYGTGYLAQYLGFAAAFLLTPIIFRPVLRIIKTYQLGSLADLFAFRYRSGTAGTLTVVMSILAVMPLIALQIQAITDATTTLNPDTNQAQLAFLYCALLIVFALLFGARHVSPSEKHSGLIVAIAFEAAFKLIVFLGLGLFTVLEVFGGFTELNAFAASINLPNVPAKNSLTLEIGPLLTLALMFFVAPLVMPHLFQITFRENHKASHMRTAYWAVPLYLLLMALPVIPIMWGGIAETSDVREFNSEMFLLGIGIGTNSNLAVLAAYIGGFAASTGLVIVASLSLASMTLNHVVLPFYQPKAHMDVYRWILWVRRILIISVILLAYGVYLLLGQLQNLSNLGILAFAGTLQFLPGLFGVLFWQGANRKGFIAGLGLGLIFWLTGSLEPVLYDSFNLEMRLPLPFSLNAEDWYISAISALTINAIAFVVVSVFSNISDEERSAALACSLDAIARPQRRELEVQSALEFIEQLSKPLGRVMAEREVNRALKHFNYHIGEYRPYAIRRLRDQIEANLSGLMGASVARALVDRYLPYKTLGSEIEREDIHFIEQRLEGFHSQFTGLAAELDQLRRYHRQTLMSLPIGVCSVSLDGEILMWNQVMAMATNIAEADVVGSQLSTIEEPWRELFEGFLEAGDNHSLKKEVKLANEERWYSLHKSSIEPTEGAQVEGNIILLEDQTETRLLEEELLHSERLASIGSLAAGVAHEIGNPITGIDCLAQDLKYSSDDPEIHNIAAQIREQSSRVTKIVQSLVNFAHAGKAENKRSHFPNNLYELVQEAINLLELGKKSRDVIFSNRCEPDLMIPCDPQQMIQVFINLLGNARDASPAGTTVTVQVETNDHSAIIDVIDQGSGIKSKDLDFIFDPFFTTKEVGKGTGLGLSLAYSIIEDHYGQLSAHSPAFEEAGVGTKMTIKIPLHQSLP